LYGYVWRGSHTGLVLRNHTIRSTEDRSSLPLSWVINAVSCRWSKISNLAAGRICHVPDESSKEIRIDRSPNQKLARRRYFHLKEYSSPSHILLLILLQKKVRSRRIESYHSAWELYDQWQQLFCLQTLIRFVYTKLEDSCELVD